MSSSTVYYGASMAASPASSPRTAASSPMSSPPSSPKPQLQRIRELQFSRPGVVTETWPQLPLAMTRARSSSNENFFLPRRSSGMRQSLDLGY